MPVSDVVLEPVDLSLTRMKHISANWLVKMWTYIVDNPQFIVNGFIRSGIFDGVTSDDELDDLLDEMDPASDTSTTSSSDDEQGDHRSQTAVSDDEIILDQHMSNDVTPIVLKLQ